MTDTYIKYFTGLKRNYGFCNISNGYKDPNTGKIKFHSGDYGWSGKSITDEDYKLHLNGKKSIGIQPCDDNGYARFGVIDIDPKVYKDLDIEFYLKVIQEKQLPLIPIKSKSNGLHLYVFMKEFVKAREIKDLPCSRLSELMNILENIEGKSIIWSHYTHDVRRIIAEIKKVYGEESVVDYYGATDTDARSINIKKFQTDEKCRFFVGTTHTGGYGITLTAGSNMIYFSNGYDLEKRQQSEARIDRIGQTRKMTYIDIIAEDTVDDRIVKALRNKVNIATEILGEELKQWI